MGKSVSKSLRQEMIRYNGQLDPSETPLDGTSYPSAYQSTHWITEERFVRPSIGEEVIVVAEIQPLLHISPQRFFGQTKVIRTLATISTTQYGCTSITVPM